MVTIEWAWDPADQQCSSVQSYRKARHSKPQHVLPGYVHVDRGCNFATRLIEMSIVPSAEKHGNDLVTNLTAVVVGKAWKGPIRSTVTKFELSSNIALLALNRPCDVY